MQASIENRLVDDWRSVVSKAWSIRLALGAACLSALDVFAQLVLPPHPRPWLAALAAMLGLSAAVARILSQTGISHGDA